MAGKIVADTLEHSTAGSIATNYVVNGSAKSWVSFTGTGTIAIRDSSSVSSIADNGTGDYSINFANAMNNADYSHTNAVGRTGSANATTTTWADQTTSQTQVHSRDVVLNAALDVEIASSAIHGDLA